MASKIQERVFVEGFLQKYSEAVTLIAERESPDFLMRDPNGEFGLEVAQFFRNTGVAGSPAKAAESRRMKYLRTLASAYYKAGGLPLLVKAILPDRPDFDSSALIERFQMERPIEPWERTSLVLSSNAEFHLTALPPRAGLYKRWLCINNSVGWVDSIRTDSLVPIIQAKAAKISDYRKVIGRIALLLVADRTHESGMLQWREDEPPPKPEGFDMVFLYIHPFEVVRLA
jgi:hypothetical protein